MSAGLAAVLLASLAGSLHCAGMCGPFLTAFSNGDSSATRERTRWVRLAPHAAYHAARLVTYVTLGAAAGLAGSALDLAGSALGLRRTATLLAGVLVTAWGLAALAGAFGLRVPLPRPPRFAARLLAPLLARARAWRPVARATALGFATTLLPCGWLHAFVLAAAATGAPLQGAVLMAAFWLGTVPALAFVGAGLVALLGPLRRRAPAIGAAALVAIGVLTLVRAPSRAAATGEGAAAPACHAGATVPGAVAVGGDDAAR